MKTSKQAHAEHSSSRRAQPLRQTRNNPPRSSISAAAGLGPRASLEENQVEIFPAITHFADAITALPKELVRHFTLLKEVDAKIFAPEEELIRLVQMALSASEPQRPPPVEPQHTLGPTSAPMSAQGSINGSIINGNAGSSASILDNGDVPNPASAYAPANIQRRQIFQHCAYTMQNMLVSLDEKNHVISTAAEALNKQNLRIDDCFPFVKLEISEEARTGSETHWAYPENRLPKTSANISRREIASANNIAAAAQHVAADEAAARSDARKQALLAKKGKNQHADSDFDDHQDKNKDKKSHGNSKIRKAVDASPVVGLGITNGATTTGNPRKRQKVESKGPGGGAIMERSTSSILANGAATKAAKLASPIATPVPEAKKRARNAATTNGQSKKRNNATTSAMSPSIASSPIRSTFPDPVLPPKKPSPPPLNGSRPAASRARQNSTQSIQEKRPPSAASIKQSGLSGTPDLAAAAVVTGKSVPEVKTTMKEVASSTRGEHMLADAEQAPPELIGAVVVGSRKDSTAKKEEVETNSDAMQGMQTTTIMTKSGRASKPSTPAIPQFPEPMVRSRSSRTAMETAANNNKRSHKKGAGAAAQLLAQQTTEQDDSASNAPEEDEEADVDGDEPRYCYCNEISYGEMVGCDADGCEREWFHLACVGLKVAPKSSVKWYCEDCKRKMQHKRFNGR